MRRIPPPTAATLALMAFLAVPLTAEAGASDPPNAMPAMTFSYVDPVTGDRNECREDCRRFEIPAGVDLEIRVQVVNLGDNPFSDGMDWDLWFDQPRSPFAPEGLALCFDDEHRLDPDCYHDMMDRVDWDWWARQDADRVCVPDDPSDCLDETVVITTDADFDGSRGRGVYSFMVWVDRFDTRTEVEEFDNVAGPVRVAVLPRTTVKPAKPLDTAVGIHPGREIVAPATTVTGRTSAVFAPSSSRPYAVQVIPTSAERAFTVSSGVARASLEFIPSYPGAVTVEVEQVGAWEKMTVRIRKVSTGVLLAEKSGKGSLRLEGRIEKIHLVDDRLFEVVVSPEPGTRGVRGMISVSYPDHALYIRNE